MSAIVLETDFCGDCDDVAALALLCGDAADHPEAVRLAGVAVDVGCPSTAAAIRTVLDFYGLGTTPVGIAATPDPHGCASRYLDALAAMSPEKNPKTIAADALYREVLSTAEDDSLVIVSIGYFNNLDAALHDDPALFHRKVHAVYMMAGGFGLRKDHLECNVMGHLACTRRFVRDYHGRAVYVGFECGASVLTDLTGFPAGQNHFLLKAFALRSDRQMRHPSWDPITVDLALHGENECYWLSKPGFVEIDGEGHTVFSEDASGNARHLIFTASDAEGSSRITRLVRNAARLSATWTNVSQHVSP